MATQWRLEYNHPRPNSTPGYHTQAEFTTTCRRPLERVAVFNVDAKSSVHCRSLATLLTFMCISMVSAGCERNNEPAHAPQQPSTNKAASGIDAAVSPSGATKLHLAVLHENEQEVRELLRKGANPNVTKNDGNTPLCDAAYTGNVAIVTLLLDSGAIIDLAGRGADTPLVEAIDNNKNKVMELLIDRGASLEKGELLNPLQTAAMDGNIEAVKLLLQHGANPDAAKGSIGPLQFAANSESKNRIAIMRLLIAKSADVNQRNDRGETAIFTAATEEHWDAVRLLAESGAEVNVADRMGCTLLHMAARSHEADIVRLLIAHHARTDAKDRFGRTPAVYAADSSDGTPAAKMETLKALGNAPQHQ